MRMTAKQVLAKIIKEGLPPEGWGRWVWKGQDGYGISALVPENTLPPVEEGEEVLFWWGGVSAANIPYWPEAYLPEEDAGEEEAEKVLIGHLLAEVVRALPEEERWEFKDALRELEGDHLEAEAALDML
jgi:hypothetical protein